MTRCTGAFHFHNRTILCVRTDPHSGSPSSDVGASVWTAQAHQAHDGTAWSDLASGATRLRLREGDQPLPEPRPDQPAIQDLVIADIERRKQLGLQRYGTLLKAGNGRDALVDAYEECLDMLCYLKQEITERANRE